MIDPHGEEPIDRTMLTKMSLSGKEPVPMLKDLKSLNLTRITSSLVRLQSDRKMVTLSDGSRFKFDAALVATGGKPKQLPTKAGNGLYVIRHTDDLKRLRRVARPRSHVVIIGTSFIGMEAASALTRRGLKVTVVGEDEIPFEKQFGCQISSALLSLHKRKGVKFVLGVKILQVSNDRVLLQKGEKVIPIETDLVVLAVGVAPQLDFDHDLPLAADGSVLTDKSLRANGHVWVAGDIANVGGRRIEHWRVAQQHGMVAAKRMLGKRVDAEIVPFFWTYHFEKRINYLGHATEWEDISIVGDVDRFDFIAFLTSRNKVKAVVSCVRETETALLAEVMRKPLSLSAANRAIRSIASDDYRFV